MSRVNPTIPEQEPPPLSPAVRNTMVGCLTFVVGFFGGGMIAVLLGKTLDMFRRCTPAEGLPMCGNWAAFAFGGGVIGAIVLPTVVRVKLARGNAATRNSGQ